MAYIGQQPVVGRYILLDQISGGFNGTTSGFTMSTAGGVQGVKPGLAQNVLLSLGGVIQQPGVDYTISGSGITFTTPPVSGTTFFATVLGDAQSVGTPSDGTVTPASIASGFDFGFPNVNVTGVITIASGVAATPSLSITGDTDTGLFSPSADTLGFATAGVQRLSIETGEVVVNDGSSDVDFRVESNGQAHMLFVDGGNDRIGIGKSTPRSAFELGIGHIVLPGLGRIGNGGSGDTPETAFRFSSADHISAIVGNSEKLRVDNDGRLLVGRTSAINVGAGSAATTEIQNSSGFNLSLISTLNSSGAGGIAIGKARGGSVVQDDDDLGSIVFAGHDGTDFQTRGASIAAQVDGTPGSNDMPGRLVFSTTADGASSTTERLRIDSSGNVGIGTTSPSQKLQVNGTAFVADDHIRLLLDSGNGRLQIRSSSDTTNIDLFGSNGQAFFAGEVGIGVSSPGARLELRDNTQALLSWGDTAAIGSLSFDGSSQPVVRALSGKSLVFQTNGSNERARIDTSGRLLVGVSSTVSVAGSSSFIQHHGNKTTSNLALAGYANNLGGPILSFGASRSTTVGTPGTIVSSGDILGDIRFAGDDGTDINTVAAAIRGEVDGTPGSNDMPGRLVFTTTADGSSSPTERMRIDSSGNVGIGKTSSGNNLEIEGQGNTKVVIDARTDASNGSLASLELWSKNSGGTNNFGQIEYDGDGSFIIGSAGSGGGGVPITFRHGSTERMRIDTSGRLLVGTTAAREHLNDGSDSAQVFLQGTTQNTSTLAVIRSSDNDGPAHIVLGKARGTGQGSTTVVQSGDTIGHINFEGADGSHLIRAGQISCTVDGTPGANDMPGRLKFSVTANGSNSLVRRMEISNQGRLDIFASNATDAHFVSSAASAGTSIDLITGKHSASSIGAGTGCFAVKTNGNVVNTNNSYGAISDIKLKENIADASSQWDDIKGLRVRNYNFKEETGNPTHTQIGVVAQEIETVSPGLVYETPDRDSEGTDLGTVTKSVNYSVLYMKAVKALQEAMDRIETLETSNADLLARVTALES